MSILNIFKKKRVTDHNRFEFWIRHYYRELILELSLNKDYIVETKTAKEGIHLCINHLDWCLSIDHYTSYEEAKALEQDITLYNDKKNCIVSSINNMKNKSSIHNLSKA